MLLTPRDSRSRRVGLKSVHVSERVCSCVCGTERHIMQGRANLACGCVCPLCAHVCASPGSDLVFIHLGAPLFSFLFFVFLPHFHLPFLHMPSYSSNAFNGCLLT